MKRMADECNIDNAIEVCSGVYEFDMFSAKFCRRLCNEILEYSYKMKKSGFDIRQPNSMNNYGTPLYEKGMEYYFDNLLREKLAYLSAKHFLEHGGDSLRVSHAFTVNYSKGEDTHLDMHTDDSDVTVNVCLGASDFVGGALAFCGMQNQTTHRKLRYVHEHHIGKAVIHSGKRRHGALPIASGRRINLVMWLKSQRPIKQFPYIRSRQLDPVCISHTHDKETDGGVQDFKTTNPMYQKSLMFT